MQQGGVRTSPGLLGAALAVVAGHAHLLGVVALALVGAALVLAAARVGLAVAPVIHVVRRSFLVDLMVEFTLIRIPVRIILVVGLKTPRLIAAHVLRHARLAQRLGQPDGALDGVGGR